MSLLEKFQQLKPQQQWIVIGISVIASLLVLGLITFWIAFNAILHRVDAGQKAVEERQTEIKAEADRMEIQGIDRWQKSLDKWNKGVVKMERNIEKFSNGSINLESIIKYNDCVDKMGKFNQNKFDMCKQYYINGSQEECKKGIKYAGNAKESYYNSCMKDEMDKLQELENSLKDTAQSNREFDTSPSP